MSLSYKGASASRVLPSFFSSSFINGLRFAFRAIAVPALCAVLLSWAPVSAFAASASETAPQDGGTVIIAQKGDIVSLNPLLASDAASSSVYNRMFNGLLKYDDKMNISCSLALSYEISLTQYIVAESSEISAEAYGAFRGAVDELMKSNPLPESISAADFTGFKVEVRRLNSSTLVVRMNRFSMELCDLIAKRYPEAVKKVEYKPVFRLKLREGVSWHDGEPFSAADVIFTIDTVKRFKTAAYEAYNIGSIEKVEQDAKDGDVIVTFAYPTPRAFETLQLPIVPRHRLDGQDINNARFNLSPVGTGPFRFVERAYEDYVTLARNDGYFDAKPGIGKLVFRIIPNESNMFLELLEGNIDIMQLKPDQFVKFTQTPEFEKRFVKLRFPEREYTYVGWNLKNRLFSDEAVRVALGHAIDRNTLIDRTLYNLGQVSNGPFYPSSWASNPDVSNLQYDIRRAGDMLKNRGWWLDSAENVLRREFPLKSYFGYDDTIEVVDFKFSLLINAGNKDRELCAKFIASELARIGIRVDIKTLEWKDLITRLDSTEFEAFILTWSLGYDPDISKIWHSSQIPDPRSGRYGLNSVSYRNGEVDRLLDEARRTFDQSARSDKYHRVHELIMKEQPYAFLYIADTLYAVSKKIKNVKPSQFGILHNIEKWQIQEGESR